MKRVAFLLCALVLACNEDTPGTQPTPPLVTEAGVPAPASPRRMVFHRNPFGDAFQADNLMVDGDFELTGRTDQAPWFAYDPQQGQVTLNYDTGGHCRSGVRCATLAPPQVLIGLMASPILGNMDVRLYAKVSSGKCADMSIFTFDLATNAPGSFVYSVSKTPADDGWCVFEGQTDNLAYEQPVLYVSIGASTKVTATIDEASVLPAGEMPIHGVKQPMKQVDAATQAKLAGISAWVRAHRKYGREKTAEVP